MGTQISRIDTKTLRDVGTAEAVEILCRRFPWLRCQRNFVERCVQWQVNSCPQEVQYFRWNLPRFLKGLSVADAAVDASGTTRVLDLSTWAPYALVMEHYFAAQGKHMHYVRTSHRGGTEEFRSGDHIDIVETVPLELGDGRFPFPDASFDLVFLTETIEHLTKHPQYSLAEINRVLRKGGHVLVTTPNVTGWKKIFALSNGNWDFDSPTFCGEWGHRYEYSFYQLRMLLKATGFSPRVEMASDVYFDDPEGVISSLQLIGAILFKILTFQTACAAKLWIRRGSSLFFLFQKTIETKYPTPDELLRI